MEKLIQDAHQLVSSGTSEVEAILRHLKSKQGNKKHNSSDTINELSSLLSKLQKATSLLSKCNKLETYDPSTAENIKDSTLNALLDEIEIETKSNHEVKNTKSIKKNKNNKDEAIVNQLVCYVVPFCLFVIVRCYHVVNVYLLFVL